ncbi:MAG: hypothetical protein ABSG41_11270 [Bryobacteraceae bacterium]
MTPRRYLCSDLVALRMNSADSIVHLEEIWRDGATFEAEEPVVDGVRVELRCGPAVFSGKVTQVERHEFGWRAEVEFSPLTPWSPEQFRPQHMLDVSRLDAAKSQAE